MNSSDAYTALLMRHRTMLWRMCRVRALGDRDRSCDLLQEVSIALWLNFDKLRPDATPHQERAWVRWQARSVFDQIKRRRQLPTEPLNDALSDNLSDEDILRSKELLDDLFSALEPDEQRMMQLYLKGYHADEIGKHMGLSRNAVYQRMHRAVQKMRRVVLILLALLLTSAVAVAVVPQWRQFLFGNNEPDEDISDSIPSQSDKQIIAKPTIEELLSDSVTRITHKEPPQKLEHLKAMLPILVPEAFILPDTLQPLPSQKEVTISVKGNLLTIVGADGEEVRVYDMNGNLVASRYGYGVQFITLQPTANSLFYERYYYKIKIGTRPTLLLKL